MSLKTVVYFAVLVVSTHSFMHVGRLNMGTTENALRYRQNGSAIAPEKYIAGGHKTQIGQFPWMACLNINDRKTGSDFLCAGSLIGERHVLTAAHCVEDEVEFYHDIQVYLGEYDTKTYPVDCVKGKCVRNKLVYPNKIMRHNDYDKDTFSNDIALLRLEKRAPLSAYIQPIPLPPFDLDDEENKGRSLVVVGWGETPTSDTSNVLLATELNLIPKSQCLKMESDVPAKHICAGNAKGRDTCPGDSGGPLLMYYKKKYYLSGVVSYGPDVKCGTAKLGFYTNVFKYKYWIKRNMKKH